MADLGAYESQGDDTSELRPPTEMYMEAAVLVSHVQMLESKLPQDVQHFGHPPPPRLAMCRIPDGDRKAELEVIALMAYTQRCASIQLLKESTGFSAIGAPVEVLVLSGSDQISCAALIALEVPRLSAADTMIVPEPAYGHSSDGVNNSVISLMSGGIVPIAPSPRVAAVIGTSNSRVVSVEFSVKAKNMHLTRRNHFVGKEVYTFFEPLPRNRLTPYQQLLYGNAPSSKQRNTNNNAHKVIERSSAEEETIVPYAPSGGVTSITHFCLTEDAKSSHLWISFGDGTAVRLHHAGFFPSVVQKHTDSEPNPEPLETLLDRAFVRCQLRLPPLVDTQVTMVPLPRYHPSPLAPFPTWKKPEVDDVVMTGTPASKENQDISDTREIYEAAVYYTGAMADTQPTLAFYTSEDQFAGRIQGDVIDDEYEDGGNVFGAVFGGLAGIFGGKGTSSHDDKRQTTSTKQRAKSYVWDPHLPFPSMNLAPIDLYAGFESHDSPRQVTYCTVSPGGDLAATADSLGRVCLIDLATKQVIRMWKGLRETTCHWLQVPMKTRDKPWQKSKVLYLVIHSRQRRVVEVWRTRHGPRVKSLQVGRDAQLVPGRAWSVNGYVSTCYLAHSTVPFSSRNQVERIVIDEEEGPVIVHQKTRQTTKRPDATQVSQDAAVRLNRLQQLLGNTNVPCQSIDVFKALSNIKSVKDLATALDLLAVAPALEEKMGVDGSSFQRIAISHCNEKMDEAVRDAGTEALTNPHVRLLAFKIAYFSQVVSAYDVLHRFETSSSEDVQDVDTPPLSTWAAEALSWTTTQEQIMGKSIDVGIPPPPKDSLKFYAFANACVSPKDWEDSPQQGDGGFRVYFSDSSRTRGDILVHIFKPLVGDVFAFNVVNQVFESLGIKNEHDYLLTCFGEWFMTLSVKDATRKALFELRSPMGRWLQEIVGRQLEAKDASEKKVCIKPLYEFCSESTDLVRAFWLATLCRDVVEKTAKQKEEKSYGQFSSSEAVQDWEKLLRRIRVCLLVSLRLFGIRLGVCPITVQSVDEVGNFSVYEWLAHDELAMSHKNDEIVSLENACKISSHAFDPSKEEGDDPRKVKLLQNSCLSAAISEEERAEYLVDFDDDDRLGALLLYLRKHNNPGLLVAQRALILVAKWGQTPKNLELLRDCVVALKNIGKHEYKSIAAAIRLEIWQSRIRPVYRALLMGFEDVQEVSADVVGPLFHQAAWLKEFGKLSSEILLLMSDITWEYGESPKVYALSLKEDDSTWPPVRPDFVLKRFVERSKEVDSSALEAHRVLISALLASKDVSALSRCVPSFYSLFQPTSLFDPVVPLSDANDRQHEFMQDAIVAYARHYNGPSLDSLDLGEIDYLADLWDFDLKNVRTLFLLSMYEFGKDRLVDEMLTKSAPSISVLHFCKDGVDIVCRRLNDMLHNQPKNEIRSMMSLLDADICEWIKRRAEESQPLVNGTLQVPVANTHLFALRLLSLAAVAEISKEERIKIHSLIVLSGTLVKAMEAGQSEK